MAGGLDLIDRMKNGEAFDRIISLSRVAGLSNIRVDGGTIVIGASATHAAIARSAVLTEHLPDLARFWSLIANPRIRYAGTIGGNLMSGQPHYDSMPALLALGATAATADGSGRREIALPDLGGSQALLTDIRVPFAGRRLIADRSLHPALAVYVGACIAGEKISELRVAIGGAYSRAVAFALPAEDVSPSAVGAVSATLARDFVARLPEPASDGLASASYRLRMIEVLTRRLLVRLGSYA